MTGVLKAKVDGQWVVVTAAGGGGGGGAEEVSVGTTAPLGTEELWYDTDAVNLSDPWTARWNAAWGVVGYAKVVTSQTGVTSAALVAMTGMTVTVQTVVGRRYKVTMTIAPRHGATDVVSIWSIHMDGTYACLRAISGLPLNNLSNTYQIETVVDGNGAARIFTGMMGRQNGTGVVDNYADANVSSMLLVEDVGPVALTVPIADPAPPWVPLVLTAPWVALSGWWQAPSIRRVGDMVYLRGAAGSPTAPTNPSTLAPISNVYWPSYNGGSLILPTVAATQAASTTYESPRVDLRNDQQGLIRIAWPTTATLTSGVNFLTISGISWSVTP